MKSLISAFSFLKANFIKILIFALIASATFGYFMLKSNIRLKQDNARQSENFVQVNKENQVLNLKIDEFKNLNTKDSKKIDSLLIVINKL